MRVSCPFVMLAIFAAESQCAPVNPLSVIGILGGHLEGPDFLSEHLINKRNLAGPSNLLPRALGASSLPVIGSIPSAAGLSSMGFVPDLSGVSSAPGLGSVPISIPGASSLPLRGSVQDPSLLSSQTALPAFFKRDFGHLPGGNVLSNPGGYSVPTSLNPLNTFDKLPFFGSNFYGMGSPTDVARGFLDGVGLVHD